MEFSPKPRSTWCSEGSAWWHHLQVAGFLPPSLLRAALLGSTRALEGERVAGEGKRVEEKIQVSTHMLGMLTEELTGI